MSARAQLALVKLGGSLITDKASSEAVRSEVVRRLAAELHAITSLPGIMVVLGHGSGSFGHAAAAEGDWSSADGDRPALDTVARTQDAAARLHREVIAALLEAGMTPFSLAPGSFMTSRGGRLDRIAAAPVLTALDAGLTPVTYGDVVLDGDRRARIVSTESVFLSIVPPLLAGGWKIRGAYWLGATDGVLDESGQPIREIRCENARQVLSTLRAGDAGEGVRDVTGGMRHRLETALELAGWGVSSWILDGRSQGVLSGALGGATSGTRVRAGR